MLSLLCIVGAAFGADEQVDQVSTMVMFKSDVAFPKVGESFDAQGISTYWHKGNFGAGIDVDVIRSLDFTQVKPYVTLNRGPWYLVGGYSTGDAGEYAQVGFWYINTFGKFNVVFDVRNDFGLDIASPSFLDCFGEVTHPIGDSQFYVGLDAVYDRWWQGDHTWAMVGPLVGYKFTPQISAFVRLTHEWDVLGGETNEANRLRVGLVLNF